MTPEALASACADRMWSTDRASQALGMEIVAVGPGTATLTMPVTEDMANGWEICHGGYIFTLADSAFAFACNSYNQLAVAQHNTISFLRPGKLGERLTAVAREVTRAGRSGLYDVTVSDAAGKVIAEFRGASRVIDGRHFEE